MRRSFATLGLLTIFAAGAAPSAATDNFDLFGSDPIVIRRAGNYTLRRAITGKAPAVTIAADNVALNLNGFTLTGPGNKTGEGIVIQGRANVKVRNGFVRGFGTAVLVSDSTNVEVVGLQISGADTPGLPPETGVLLVNSRGVHVANNLIARTFLGVFVRGSGSGANTIKGNTIAGGDHGQLGICYNPAPGADPATDGPAGDLVAENHISRYQTAVQLSPASRASIFVRNYLNFFATAFDEQTPGSNTLANNLEATLPQ